MQLSTTVREDVVHVPEMLRKDFCGKYLPIDAEALADVDEMGAGVQAGSAERVGYYVREGSMMRGR